MTQYLTKCPICESQESFPFLAGSIDQKKLTSFSYASRKEPEFMSLPLVTCLNCDLVYTTTPLTDNMLKEAYIVASYDSSKEANFAAKTYYNIIKSWISKLPQKKCAIDIGTGNGALLPLLKQQNFEQVIGIEPSIAAIEASSPDIKSMIRKGLFSAELISDVTPDFIFTAMTMEHVNDPLLLVQIMKEKLSSEGMIAIVVHNYRAFLNRLLGSHSPIIDIEHLQLFSPKSLEKLFSQAGLEMVEIKPFSNSYPLHYWIKLLPLPSYVKNRLNKILKFFKLSDIAITMPVGNMIGIARKLKV